ncbi:MAG: NAD(+)/NADH kinase [Phycisphaerae bacterium]|nr:NAD(+)/NADH kinase [Phycisphaerae bacterium]
MTATVLRRVLVLVNPHAGLGSSFTALRRAMDRHWEGKGRAVFYQFSQGAEDAGAKAQAALASGCDAILVVGGDGTVNSVGRVLVGSETALGVIPAGSGNGFARHFGIPLAAEKAAAALAGADVKRIDVGRIDGRPFFVTCSMAWDASIVKSFERMPFRGILPYIFAGVQEFIGYEAQQMDVVIDGGETVTFADPVVFTIANLTQFGGGARIAPDARADDGKLDLVVALQEDVPKLIANLGRLFDGSVRKVPEIMYRAFRELRVHRPRGTAIQLDGELAEAGADVTVRVQDAALKVLVPARGGEEYGT